MILEGHSLPLPHALAVKLGRSHRAKLSLRDTIPPCLGEDAVGNDFCKQKDKGYKADSCLQAQLSQSSTHFSCPTG